MTGKTVEQLVGCLGLWNETTRDFHLSEDFMQFASLHLDPLPLLFWIEVSLQEVFWNVRILQFSQMLLKSCFFVEGFIRLI